MDYSSYYERIIEQNAYGFKLALGGTGIGKTRGIRDVIQKQRVGEDNRKFIYCANRIQLLNEMYDDLIQKNGIAESEVIHLERNRDTVLNAFSSRNRSTFYELFESDDINRLANQSALDLVSVRRSCRQIEQIVDLMAGENQEISALVENTLESNTRDVKNFFNKILRTAPDDDWQRLIQNKTIQILFPYIAFKHRSDTRILLITIHKGFLGFFDGRHNINLTQIQNCIVFLDEFDFLEQDLIQLICNSPQIEDPFVFVELFHRAMKRHKLPLDDYPETASNHEKIVRIREHLVAIVELVDKLKHEGIPFPDINQFTTHIEQKQAAIFQTNRTIIKQPLHLETTPRSFEILLHQSPDSFSAMELFNTVSWAAAQILFLFKDIETVDQTIYDEMLNHCFPQSYLADQVRRISQLPQPYRKHHTRFDNLLEAGFGLYEIQDLQQVTDRDEVRFRHYAIHTTPEKVLLSIALKNLVFGLSATADLPRFVKHFNENWLRKQLRVSTISEYFEVDVEDETIIQALNKRKLADRQNEVHVMLARNLSEHPQGKQIADYIKLIAEHFAEFGGDDKHGHRRRRVERFFAALLWISEKRQPDKLAEDTHILFYNTFSQIKFIFKTQACHADDLFKIERISEDQHFAAYRIYLNAQPMNIIFYDAGQAKYIHSSEDVKRRYHELFWEGTPVILITQYASAGNGVNLQYRPYPEASDDEETDFLNIHLMEAPYFYFDTIDPRDQTSQEISTAIKKNIWYQAKLYEAKVVSASVFFNLLENLRFYNFNDEYRYSTNLELRSDALKNRIATYIQALGRVERVWRPMLDQNVFLADEVFDDFAAFCTDEDLSYIRDTRKARLSSNLSSIIDQVEYLAEERQKQARRYADERLSARNEKSKQSIRELLQRLHAFRNGSKDYDARGIWTALRLAALEHGFANELLAQYYATFKTSYEHDGYLYLDDDLILYPHDKRPHYARPWRLNAIYDLISENPTIEQYFTSRGFELEFNSVSGQYFTPYFYQSILVGAIGEAAIQAILGHELILLERDLPDPLFELADLKIQGVPWYIDCKNYSERTMSYFPLTPGDPAYRPKLNEHDFIANTQAKLAYVRRHHNDQPDNCKLIYLNLVGNTDRIRLYLDKNFDEVAAFDEASIIVIQGILQSNNPEEYNLAFQQFLSDCHHSLA